MDELLTIIIGINYEEPDVETYSGVYIHTSHGDGTGAEEEIFFTGNVKRDFMKAYRKSLKVHKKNKEAGQMLFSSSVDNFISDKQAKVLVK